MVFQEPVRTAQQTHSIPVTKANQLMLYREIISVCSEIHKKKKHLNTVCGQNVKFVDVKLVVHIVTAGL